MTPTPATEFPHVNPSLSTGALWSCLAPSKLAEPRRMILATVRPRVTLRAACTAMAEDAVPPEIVVPARESVAELAEPPSEPEPTFSEPEPTFSEPEPTFSEPEPMALSDAHASEPTVPDHAGDERIAEKSDDFAVYAAAMVNTLLASGATRAASILQQWLTTGRFDAAGLDASVRGCLATAGYVEADRPTPNAEATLEAWRAVLSGRSQDLSACGERTLDDWSAGLVTALLGRSERVSTDVRRTLRRAGIAAFGVIAQAA